MADVPGPSSAPYFSQRRSTENFSRLCQLIMTICSDLFRTILSQYIKPENLRKELDNNRTSLEEIINFQQRNLLYPPAPQSKYLVSSDLDVSILYILFRNICNIPKHKNGWGKPPKRGDNCLAACIERIKFNRNLISGHSTKGEIDDTLFKDFWSKLSSDIVRIEQMITGGDMFQRGVDELLTCELNPSRAQKYVEAFSNVQSELLFKQEKINDLQNSIVNIGHKIAVKRGRIDDSEDQNAAVAKVLKDGFSELKEELKDSFVKLEKELKKEQRDNFIELEKELKREVKNVQRDERENEKVKEREKERAMIVGIDRRQDQKDGDQRSIDGECRGSVALDQSKNITFKDEDDRDPHTVSRSTSTLVETTDDSPESDASSDERYEGLSKSGSPSGTLSREMPNISGIITSPDCSRIPLRHSNWLNPDERELENVKERERERDMILGIDRRQDQMDRYRRPIEREYRGSVYLDLSKNSPFNVVRHPDNGFRSRSRSRPHLLVSMLDFLQRAKKAERE